MIASARARLVATCAAFAQRTGSRAVATAGACPDVTGSGAPTFLPRRHILALSSLLGFAALLLAASPAMAGEAHVFKASFGSPGHGDGQFSANVAVAVDNSAGTSKGDVYVADSSNHRIEKFDSSGNFLLAFGANVGGAGVNTCASGCVEGSSGSTPGAFETPTFLAVDSSGGGEGDVYVGDTGDGRISKFDASGNLITSWSSGGQLEVEGEFDGLAVDSSGTLYVLSRREHMSKYSPDGSSAGEFQANYETTPIGIAVDSAGDIYKARASGVVAKLNPSGESLIGEVDPGPTAGLAVEPSTDDLYVAHSGFISLYDSSGNVLETSFGATHIISAAGVAVAASGRTYVSDPGASAVEIFDPVEVPNVTTGSASEITKTTATVSGQLEPAGAGEEVTGCRFEYGTDTSYGHSAPCAPAPPYTEPKDVSAELIGLSASTEYHYRIVAENPSGFEAIGLDGTFNTPLRPSLSSVGTEGDFGETTATLHGLVNPEGSKTEFQFEYASSPSGPFTSTATQTLPFEDKESHSVEAKVTGLQPDTVYYIRLSATNEVGTSVEPQPQSQSSNNFETFGPPAVETYAVHSVGVAKGVPQGTYILMGNVTNHGFETHYHFEYVSQEKFEQGEFAEAQSTPEVEGSGLMVTQDLPALEPGKTYHYRLTATNGAAGNPVVHGNEQTLKSPIPGRTESGEEEDQPSPCPNEVDRYGASARLPDCRAYEQITPVDKEGTQDNWIYGATQTITTPGLDGEHVAISTLSRFGKNDNPGADTTYLFSRAQSGWQMTSTAPQPESGGDRIAPAEFFTPGLSNFLVSREWQTTAISTSPEVELLTGPAGGPYTLAASAPRSDETAWMAQSRDASTAVLESEDHELTGVSTGTTQGSDLYEWKAGQLRQLNVQTNGSPIGTCGAHIVHGWEGEGQGSELGQTFVSTASINSISPDGSRIFFEAVPGSNCGEPSHLYMRQNGDETLDIGAYNFHGATPEGTRLFLSKGGDCPAVATQGCEGAEFFSYDTETEVAKHLFDEPGQIPFFAHVVSEDGNVFYFNKIQRYDIATETMTFVAFAAYNSGGGYGGYYTSPNGNNLYFTSLGVAGVPAGPSIQSYRYDAAENLVQCMSCASLFNPEPNRHSQIMESRRGQPRAGPARSALTGSANGNFAFFSSESELVPRDINGEIEEPWADGTSPPRGRL